VSTVFAGSGALGPEFYTHFPDLFVSFAAAAAVTRTIRFGTGIILVAEHNSFHLAKAAATLDMVSGGRLEFGVGYGWNKPELLNNGVQWGQRREVFAEKLAVLKRLWTEEAVAHDGTYGSFTESWVWPKPVQKPHPPILLGAPGYEWQLRQIVDLADGWYPLDSPELPARLQKLRAMAAEAGRPEPLLTVSLGVSRTPRNPWYFEASEAMDALLQRAELYQSLGAQRLVVGIPMADVGTITRSLDSLATMVDRFA
jgi:probable F420-dependent oxidoreductase